ncbi:MULTISPECIES: hypothetical protein [Pseudomonas]|uniref:Uncharacterized protein n=2 Tax=Pseudomonas TaxID=286 RepID=A0A8T8LZ75_PSESX|nr:MULTISPECIES: hypothetical protein [Pseudomonas]MEE4667162.1 hypothetical protein [Pseudomonas alliivorans]MBF7141954.1 hypothetical protein [Pseudomonas sp. LY10J]NJP00492.1 hypothetical protein [Pseudomonas quercus]PBP51585.1 hypothetical protein CCL18_26335 [Pseudomonas syringae]QUP66647.1 hypothetical protein PSYCIT7_002980 [Pseudomonas syringae Cit 7]
MLAYQITGTKKLTFSWPDAHTRKGFTTRNFEIPEGLQDRDLKTLSDAVVRRASRLSEQSAAGYVQALNRILKNIDRSEDQYPPHDWDAYLYEHFSSHLEDPSTQYSVRIAEWHKIKDIYVEVQRRGFIPTTSLIPSASIHGGCHDSAEQPLGHETIHLTVPSSLNELLPKWELVESGLELDDDTYIEGLKNKLKTGADAVVAACAAYWKKMRQCHQIGKELTNKISEPEITTMLRNKAYIVNGVHLAHPSQPLGINWFLAVLKYYIKNTTILSAISSVQLMEIPFFRPIIYNNRTRKLWLKKIREIAGNNDIPKCTITETLCRLLGLLSSRDCAAACCILISENPSFPPYSLITSSLYTQAGKFYLRARSGGKSLIFSVDKPRAGKRKTSLLPKLSAEIITDLIECTEIPRANLKGRKKTNWRKLFLVANESQIGCTGRAIAKVMAFNTGITLYSVLKPELISAGIKDREFNLSTLRTTQGILTFLEYGSLRKVADTLNNSVQVVRARYIPDWLIIRWATRAIRIMQQKLIIVATEGEPWQLEASDFLTATALRSFISKMLRDIKNGDAFSEMVNKRLGKYLPKDSNHETPHPETELVIGIDERSIAAMYTYINLYPNPPQENLADTHDEVLIMSDSKIRQITCLLTSAAELINSELSMVESAIIDKLTGDSIAEFRHVHKKALIVAAQQKDLLSNKHGLSLTDI